MWMLQFPYQLAQGGAAGFAGDFAFFAHMLVG
jgi:hypothetical protein